MKYQVRGAEQTAQNMETRAKALRARLPTLMDKAVKYVHSTVPKYPAPPAASTYTRTGTLGRSISTEVRGVGSKVVGVIGTATVYAPYVIDEKRQAWMHKGRWWTLQKVVRDARQMVLKILRDGVMDIVKR